MLGLNCSIWRLLQLKQQLVPAPVYAEQVLAGGRANLRMFRALELLEDRLGLDIALLLMELPRLVESNGSGPDAGRIEPADPAD